MNMVAKIGQAVAVFAFTITVFGGSMFFTMNLGEALTTIHVVEEVLK